MHVIRYAGRPTLSFSFGYKQNSLSERVNILGFEPLRRN